MNAMLTPDETCADDSLPTLADAIIASVTDQVRADRAKHRERPNFMLIAELDARLENAERDNATLKSTSCARGKSP